MSTRYYYDVDMQCNISTKIIKDPLIYCSPAQHAVLRVPDVFFS
jgi:hypothetical protein